MAVPAYRCLQGGAAPAPPPPPARAAPATRLLQALAELASRDGAFLGTGKFQAPGCMRLVLDFEAAAVQAPPEVVGVAGTEARGRFLCRLLHATFQQHSDWLAGVAAAPSRQQFHKLASLHVLPHRGDQAQRSFISAVQEQVIAVQVADCEFAVPVRAVLGHLPADHCRIVMRGLPAHCAIAGVTEALLRAAGYGADSAVTVVHERAGVLSAAGLGSEDAEFSVPVLDTVVAVVLVPQEYAGLPLLPRSLAGSGWEASISVEADVVPAGQLVLRHTAVAAAAPAAGLPPVLHPGVRPGMARVYAAGGITAVTGTSAVESAAARTPGDRTGLGFAPAGPASGAAAPAPLQPAPLACAPQAPSPPQEPMPPAAPAPSLPMDEPGFDAACELVGDALDGCSSAVVQQIVLQARAAAPAAYAEAEQVTTPSSLPRGFRAALYAQARVLVGAQLAGPLEVLGPLDVDGLPGSAADLLGLLPPPLAAAGARREAVGSTAVQPAPVVGVVASPSPATARRQTRVSTGAGGGGKAGWLELQRSSMGGGTVPSGGRGKARGRGSA